MQNKYINFLSLYIVLGKCDSIGKCPLATLESHDCHRPSYMMPTSCHIKLLMAYYRKSTQYIGQEDRILRLFQCFQKYNKQSCLSDVRLLIREPMVWMGKCKKKRNSIRNFCTCTMMYNIFGGVLLVGQGPDREMFVEHCSISC